jgi:D-alanine-D-alanine ligase
MTSGSRRNRIRVGVVFGGRSGEHDVSLRSAQTVMAALEASGHDVIQIGITREGAWLTEGDPMATLQAGSPLFAIGDGGQREDGEVLASVNALSIKANQSSAPAVIPASGWAGELDVIFPVLHGPMGEDGTVQGLFELAGLPYVGAGVMSSSVSMDKSVTKQLLAQSAIPQAPWLTVLRKEWQRFPDAIQADIERELGYPCFVKPANLGSSVGISKVHDSSELPAAMREAGNHDRKIVIEKGINARELEVSVLGNDEPVASVIGEIVPAGEFYDYEAKYVDDDSELIVPADIPDDVADEIRAVAVRAFRVLDCAGMARIDFLMDRESHHIYLNEVNTIPGFTSISMYPILWEASGLPLPDLVSRLVELAVERHAERHGQD